MSQQNTMTNQQRRAIIALHNADEGVMDFTELARKFGWNNSTALAVLNQLCDDSFARESDDDEGVYCLTADGKAAFEAME